jgi:hypothetical protein
MELNFKIQPKTRVRMHRRDFQSVQTVKPGSTLFCDTGILWVTQAGDRQDYVLLPGQKMTVTKRGKVLIEAMRDADFHVA